MEDKKQFVDRLSAILVSHHVLVQAELPVYHAQFAKSEHDGFEYFLLDEGIVTKEQLLHALSVYYDIPAVDVEGFFFDTELLRNFPKDFLLRNEVIPLQLDEDFLVVAAANPFNQTLVSAIGTYVSTDIQFNVGLGRDICDAIKEYYDHSMTEDAHEFEDASGYEVDESQEDPKNIGEEE